MHNLLANSLHGGKLIVETAYEIFNPVLVTNFASGNKILARMTKEGPAPKLDWQNDRKEQRTWVANEFTRRINSFPWNHSTEWSPIMAVLHGTSASVAWKISSNGFAALAALDAGFYGNGMYFSSDAMYTLPYYALKPDPAILISFVTPGNPYPVVEHHAGSTSLMGQSLKMGYQSHYALTRKDGMIPDKILTKSYYDELVISQEAQVVPAYLIEVGRENLDKLVADFNHVVQSVGSKMEGVGPRPSSKREVENSLKNEKTVERLVARREVDTIIVLESEKEGASSAEGLEQPSHSSLIDESES
jgi:hypothetical protein